MKMISAHYDGQVCIWSIRLEARTGVLIEASNTGSIPVCSTNTGSPVVNARIRHWQVVNGFHQWLPVSH